MTPRQIFNEAKRRGIHLEPDAPDKLAYWPPDKLDPEFRAVLLANKSILIPWLKKRFAPQLHLAKEILQGEFSGATREEIFDLFRAMQHSRHPIVEKAREKLRADYYRTHESKLNHHHREK
jgi:hypothetical protein